VVAVGIDATEKLVIGDIEHIGDELEVMAVAQWLERRSVAGRPSLIYT